MSDNQAIAHAQPCIWCDSSDAMAVYPDHLHCFSCGKHKYLRNEDPYEYISKVKDGGHMNEESNYSRGFATLPTERGTYALTDRGITEATVQKFGVTVERYKDSKDVYKHIYPYYTQDGNQIHKQRTLPKSFISDPAISTAQLFGQHLFTKGSAPSITVVAGELDALAAHQMFDSKWPVVSVPSASQAKRAFKENLEFLESFSNVIIMFDNQESEQEAARECANLLSPRKAKLYKHTEGLKDACDYLSTGKQELFKRNWFASEVWIPEGIVAGKDLLERILNKKEVKSVPYPWEELQRMTYGIRRGELTVFTAKTNVGKTQILREIEYHIFMSEPEARLGALFMEESVETSGLGVLSIHANKILHLPDTKYTNEELTKYHEQVLGQDRIFYYNADSGTQLEDVVAKIRYYAKALDCHYIFLDNFTILTTDHNAGNDERKRIDTSVGQLVKIAKELDVAFIAVAHLNREGQIRGSTAIENFAHIIVQLDRDIENPDPMIRNTMNMTITKNRFCGRAGPAGSLLYNQITGRLEEQGQRKTFNVVKDVTPVTQQTKPRLFEEI